MTFQVGRFCLNVLQNCCSYSTTPTCSKPAVSRPIACPPPPAHNSKDVKVMTGESGMLRKRQPIPFLLTTVGDLRRHRPTLKRSSHSRGSTSQLSFGPDTAVAGPRSRRLVRTRAWQDLAAVVWSSHSRGGTSRRSFGADTGVAGPPSRRLAWTRPWRDLATAGRCFHGCGRARGPDTLGRP